MRSLLIIALTLTVILTLACLFATTQWMRPVQCGPIPHYPSQHGYVCCDRRECTLYLYCNYYSQGVRKPF